MNRNFPSVLEGENHLKFLNRFFLHNVKVELHGSIAVCLAEV